MDKQKIKVYNSSNLVWENTRFGLSVSSLPYQFTGTRLSKEGPLLDLFNVHLKENAQYAKLCILLC